MKNFKCGGRRIDMIAVDGARTKGRLTKHEYGSCSFEKYATSFRKTWSSP